MIDEGIEPEGAIIREAEYVGLWMLFRAAYRRMGRGIRTVHKHHWRLWAMVAAILWLAFAALCIYGVIDLVHLQSSEKACQLMGTCK